MGYSVIFSSQLFFRKFQVDLTVTATVIEIDGGEIKLDCVATSAGVKVLYTDVWMSMGDSEVIREKKIKDLSLYAITQELMSLTAPDAVFMHCLPAHRGEEVSAEVMDGARSIVWREAFHRRTTIQALLFHLIRGDLKGSNW